MTSAADIAAARLAALARMTPDELERDACRLARSAEAHMAPALARARARRRQQAANMRAHRAAIYADPEAHAAYKARCAEYARAYRAKKGSAT